MNWLTVLAALAKVLAAIFDMAREANATCQGGGEYHANCGPCATDRFHCRTHHHCRSTGIWVWRR